jgi:hypothetical protein
MRTFTTENIVSGLKTFAWVGPLTILIWVYAEREQIATSGTVVIPFAITSADPSRIVKPLMADSSVTAELVGPRAMVEKVAEMIRRSADAPLVQIEVDRSYPPGQHRLETAREVANQQVFKMNGVTVQDCKPMQIPILIDQLVELEVEVQKPPEVTNLSGPPVFEPRVVKVRGPKSVLEGQEVKVYADLSSREELRTPGPREIPTVPLITSVKTSSVTVQPSTVRATLDVRPSDLSYTIASMPVWPTPQPGLLERFRIEYENNDPFVKNVTVVGPPATVEAIKSDKFQPAPKARFEVTREDTDDGWLDRRLLFDLPQDVRVSDADKNRTIRFRLVPLGGGE